MTFSSQQRRKAAWKLSCMRAVIVYFIDSGKKEDLEDFVDLAELAGVRYVRNLAESVITTRRSGYKGGIAFANGIKDLKSRVDEFLAVRLPDGSTKIVNRTDYVTGYRFSHLIFDEVLKKGVRLHSDAYLGEIKSSDSLATMHAFRRACDGIAKTGSTIWFEDVIAFSRQNSYRYVFPKAFWNSTFYRRSLSTKLDKLKHIKNLEKPVFRDGLVKFAYPSPTALLNLSSENFEGSFLFVFPIYDFMSQKCITDGYSAALDNGRITFNYLSKAVFSLPLSLYHNFFSTDTFHIKKLHNHYFVSSEPLQVGEDVSMVSMVYEHELFVCPTNLFTSIRQEFLLHQFDMEKLRGRLLQLVPNVTPTFSERFLQVMVRVCVDDIVAELPNTEEESVLLATMLAPLILAGQFLRVITTLVGKFVGRMAQKLVKRSLVFYQVSCEKILPIADGLWKAEFVSSRSSHVLTGRSYELAKKIEDLNGYTRILESIFLHMIPVDLAPHTVVENASVSPDTLKVLIKETATALDQNALVARYQWHLREAWTAPDEFQVIPDLKFIKYTESPYGRYKAQNVYLPIVPRGMPRTLSVQAMMHAVGSRNAAVTHLDSAVDANRLFDENIDKYAKLFFRPDWREMVRDYASKPVVIDWNGVVDYVRNMPEIKVKEYHDATLKALEEADYSYFQAILKKDAKEQLTGTKVTIKAPQTVFFLGPENGASAQAFFGTITKRWKSLFSDKVFVMDGKSDEEVDRINNSIPGLDPNAGIKSIQGDMSAFDKSQGHTALTVTRRMYQLLGADKTIIDLYSNTKCHGVIKMTVLGLMFRAAIEEMQRSGLPTTLLGNSIVVSFAILLSRNFDPKEVLMIAMQGDDSEVLVKKDYIPEKGGGTRSADLLNLEEKLLIFNAESRYFCSRFYLWIRGRWVTVYDPVKGVCKLMTAKTTLDALDEQYESHKLLGRGLNDFEIRDSLTVAMCKFYGFSATTSSLIIFTWASALANKEQYCSIWSNKPTLI